jgi:hypothetical protein
MRTSGRSPGLIFKSIVFLLFSGSIINETLFFDFNPLSRGFSFQLDISESLQVSYHKFNILGPIKITVEYDIKTMIRGVKRIVPATLKQHQRRTPIIFLSTVGLFSLENNRCKHG